MSQPTLDIDVQTVDTHDRPVTARRRLADRLNWRRSARPPRPPTVAATAGHRSWGHFARHYVEMVVAMAVGMVVFGAVVRGLLAAAGLAYSHAEHPELASVEMAFTMSAGMTVWMRFRGHGWAGTLEMDGAMFASFVVPFLLLWTGVIPGESVLILGHVVMLPLMLVVMLRRRGEFSAAHVHGGRIGRALGRGLVALLAFNLLPVAVGAAGFAAHAGSLYPLPDGTAPTAAVTDVTAPPPAHDPGKPTAAIVVGNKGANVADTLASYEVLAATGEFNVYTVAPERRPVPLTGGLDLVPDLTFDQLDQRLGAAPEVTVVPAMPDSGEPTSAPVTAWLEQTASDGLLLSVCNGAKVLASAGLLDGRDATSHWIRIAELERQHPEVNWKRGIRYVDDGDVITTGGLLSTIDGTLRVVERLVGTDTAAKAAQAVGWRHYSPGTPAPIPQSGIALPDAIAALNVAYRWDAPTVGVLLTDGVGELELASAFDSYAEQSMAARTLAVAASSDSIRSRHGLTFVPRADLDSAAARVDRLLVPGADAARRNDPDLAAAARRADVALEYLHQQPGFAFDAALRDVARTMDVPTAQWVAKMLEYPTAGIGLSGPGWPWMLILRPLVLGLAGLAVAVGAGRLLRTRRQTRQAALASAAG